MSNTIESTHEQLMYKAWLQVFFLIIAVALTLLFTLPKLQEVSAQAELANEKIEIYNNMYNNGIASQNLLNTIKSVGNNPELVEVVTKAWDAVNPIIAKTGSKPYLEWLKENSLNNDADRAKLADAQAKINSIIPTISPMSNHHDAKSVTLREYIGFIEEHILAKYEIESLSPLGIDGVKYQENKDAWLENPVGILTVELNFKASNKNIIELLNFIQASGETSLLSREEILDNPPAIMSNPLITINSLSLTNLLNPSEPSAENTGRLSLNFYVRGSSDTDVNYLLTAFNKRKNNLKTDIQTKLEECKKSGCPGIAEYEKIAARFQTFDSSLSAILKKDGNAVETAYIIGQQLPSLQAIRSALENIK